MDKDTPAIPKKGSFNVKNAAPLIAFVNKGKKNDEEESRHRIPVPPTSVKDTFSDISGNGPRTRNYNKNHKSQLAKIRENTLTKDNWNLFVGD